MQTEQTFFCCDYLAQKTGTQKVVKLFGRGAASAKSKKDCHKVTVFCIHRFAATLVHHQGLVRSDSDGIAKRNEASQKRLEYISVKKTPTSKRGEIKKGFANRANLFLLRLLSAVGVGTPSGTRTLDTLIKSQVLYQLS